MLLVFQLLHYCVDNISLEGNRIYLIPQDNLTPRAGISDTLELVAHQSNAYI